MYKPKILVTGATGKTGSAVVSELLAKGWLVRALVRKKDTRAEQLARRGAEVAVADLFDTEQLRSAMRGTERAYFLPVCDPRILDVARMNIGQLVDLRCKAGAPLALLRRRMAGVPHEVVGDEHLGVPQMHPNV